MKGFKYVLIVMFLAALMFVGKSAQAQLLFMQKEQVGQPVIDFTLPSLSGQQVHFEKARDGKNAIIFFWATWCPHCREALKELNERHQEIVDKGVELVIVNVGEEKGTVEAYMKSRGIVFDMLIDADTALAQQYAVVGVPTFIFVNKDGVIVDVGHQLMDDYVKIFERPLPSDK